MRPKLTSNIQRRGLPVSNALTSIAFVFIFVFYFLYQIAVVKEKIPELLGGYFTAGTTLGTILTLTAFLTNKSICNTKRIHFLELAFFGFVFTIIFCTLSGVVNNADPEITSSHLAFAFKFVCLWFFARCHDSESTAARVTSPTSIAIVISLILVNASEGQFLKATLTEYYINPTGFLLDYQGLGFALVVIAIFSIPPMRVTARFCIYPLVLASLFLLGARSEFVGFLIAGFLIELSKTKNYFFYAVASATIVALSITTISTLSAEFADHRVVALLNVADDRSAIERIEMHHAALLTIEQSPFFGKYASYEVGHYAHNILSAWVDLGLIGFAMCAFVSFAPLTILLRHIRHGRGNTLYAQALAASAVTAVLLVTAKTFTYQMIPIAIGLFGRFYALKSTPRFHHSSKQGH